MTFTVYGKIKGKGRPRFAAAGRVYTPEDTVNYETLVAMEYKAQGGKYTEQPLTMRIEVFYDVPKSTAKRTAAQMINGAIRPAKKPDCDNIAKVICDALNKVAYRDDAQIVGLSVEKHYTAGNPYVEVDIREV